MYVCSMEAIDGSLNVPTMDGGRGGIGGGELYAICWFEMLGGILVDLLSGICENLMQIECPFISPM